MTGDQKVSEAVDKPVTEPAKSAATVLVEMALEQHDFKISTDGETFAVPKVGPRLVRQLRGGKVSLRAELARQYREQTKRVAPQQALADALLALEGEANDTSPVPLALRVAECEGVRYLDLGDNTGRAVRIDHTGWRIVDQPPVLFRRTVLTSPLPEPVHGGDLADLWSVLNVQKDDQVILAAWLVSVLLTDIPHPILALLGEQGTGKTTAARILSGLLDPSPVPVRKSPRDADSWVTAASGSWVVALDNLSTLSDWLSDTLCRAVTGDGDVKRQLYTDGGLVVFSFRRCILLTGIDLGALRGDLADRLLTADLEVIQPEHRLEEAVIWRRWQQIHPALLGAILDLAASVASVLPSVRLASRPRMADFARVLAAVDIVLGTAGLKRYTDRAGTLAEDSLTGDPFVMAMAEQLPKETAFEGTSADLLGAISPPDEKRLPKDWPASARAVTTLLKRQAPVMRKAEWQVSEGAPGHANAIRWRIIPPPEKTDEKPDRPEIAGISDSQHSQTRGSASDASVASVPNGQSQDDPSGWPVCPDCQLPMDSAGLAGGYTTHPNCGEAA